MLRILLSFTIVFCWASSSILAQSSPLYTTESLYAVPSVANQSRSKGVVYTQEWVTDYGIQSSGSNDSIGDGAAEVQINRRIEVKVKIPIINKDRFKWIIGLDHYTEKYTFEEGVDYPFYQSISEKELKSYGFSNYFILSTQKKRYYLLRTKASLNGDFRHSPFPTSDYLKISVAPMIGWKKNENTAYAIGLALGYDFGRPSIYPVLTIKHTINDHWGLVALLPANAKLRYNLNDKTIFHLIAELQGGSYNIKLGSPSDFENNTQLHFNKSEALFHLNLEREIYDFLWLGASGGYRQNIAFNLHQGNSPRADVVIGNTVKGALFFNFSLFLVPPRSWSDGIDGNTGEGD